MIVPQDAPGTTDISYTRDEEIVELTRPRAIPAKSQLASCFVERRGASCAGEGVGVVVEAVAGVRAAGWGGDVGGAAGEGAALFDDG